MRKKVRMFLEASKTRGKLDPGKIRSIARKLPRSELKEYLQGLKLARREEMVTVELPIKRGDIERILQGKLRRWEIGFIENRKILSGFRIRVGDEVLELSLRDVFDRVYDHYR